MFRSAMQQFVLNGSWDYASTALHELAQGRQLVRPREVAADRFEWNLIACWEFINFNLSTEHCYDSLCGKSMRFVRTYRGCRYYGWYGSRH